jgi:HD superfamily phosphodiesterase
MNLDALRKLVAEQYAQKHPNRDAWADWLYENHVLWVANKTEEWSTQLNLNIEISVAAALLHDIADSVMQRSDQGHEQKSLEIARNLCQEAGYSQQDTATIVDDICTKHSCRNGIVPESEEGKVMASADAASHYMTEFYFYAFNSGSNWGDYDYLLAWARKKIERDYAEKIFHDFIREELRPHYNAWQLVLNLQ